MGTEGRGKQGWTGGSLWQVYNRPFLRTERRGVILKHVEEEKGVKGEAQGEEKELENGRQNSGKGSNTGLNRGFGK